MLNKYYDENINSTSIQFFIQALLDSPSFETWMYIMDTPTAE